MEKILTCIGCPMGCQLIVTLDEEGNFQFVTGYSCKVGKEYAPNEIANPTRMVTSVLLVPGTDTPLCVKTAKPIPKGLIFDCLKEIRNAKVTLPVKIGDVIVPNVCGTGIDVVATRHLK
jgi:CxxC motif-containing protein